MDLRRREWDDLMLESGAMPRGLPSRLGSQPVPAHTVLGRVSALGA